MISFKQLKHGIYEASGQGGFDYEKDVNDKLKKHGKADKNQGTAGASADAPDAKFKHNNAEHNLEIKADHKAMFGQIELHHDGKKWDVSERSKKKYPHTHKAIQDSGFLHKVNKQWGKPSGDYDKDLQMGNVYHEHPDAEPIKSHYGKDRKTNYIQIGKGHGFYHTGNDAGKLGSPELEGKTQLRARMKYRGTDASGKKKFGALVVMSLKDAQKSHHDLDAPVQKEWIDHILNGSTNLSLDENLQIEVRTSNAVKLQRAFERQQAKSAASRERAKEILNPKKEQPKAPMKEELDESLWANIHAKRKRGERAAKPGEKGYPKTLKIEEIDSAKKDVAKTNIAAKHAREKESLAIRHTQEKERIKEEAKDFSKYTMKPTKTEPKIVRKTNPAGRTTDHVEYEVHGTLSSHKKTFKSKKEAEEYFNTVKEEVELNEDAYAKSEENKRSADSAKKQGNMFDYHMHMSDHHDNLSQHNSQKGRSSVADSHAAKSEQHHEKAMKLKEEVAANNVGSGKIAGTQGDAGKKAVMTKKPLRRFKDLMDK